MEPREGWVDLNDPRNRWIAAQAGVQPHEQRATGSRPAMSEDVDDRLPVPTLDGTPTDKPLPFRVAVTLIARSLAGISAALHRIADDGVPVRDRSPD